MATKICPNCKSDSFIWRIDDSITTLTIWGCYDCSYESFENESLERRCLICKSGVESQLEDENKKYWWCSSCNSITGIKN